MNKKQNLAMAFAVALAVSTIIALFAATLAVRGLDVAVQPSRSPSEEFLKILTASDGVKELLLRYHGETDASPAEEAVIGDPLVLDLDEDDEDSEAGIGEPPMDDPSESAEDAVDPVGYDFVPLPEELREYTEALCADKDVPASLVYGMMYVESRFDTSAESEGGDCGLMQLSSRYSEFFADQYGVNNLFDPYGNVKCGVNMMAGYLGDYDTPEEALMAYNCGPTAAAALMEDGVYSTEYTDAVIKAAKDIEAGTPEWDFTPLYDSVDEHAEIDVAAETPKEEPAAEEPSDSMSANVDPFTEKTFKLKVIKVSAFT